MITVQRTVTAAQPTSEVFAYLSDFANATEWDAGTVSCSKLSGDGGVGSRYRNVSRFLGRETELVYVVRAVEPDTRFVIEGSNNTVTSTDTMLIRPRDGGTEVAYTAEFRFSGAARWLEPLLRLPLRRLGDNAERTLRDALAAL